MSVINIIFLKYNIIISLIMHLLFIVCAVNFYNSKKQLPTENYKTIEIDLISLIKKEKKIKPTFPLEKKKLLKILKKAQNLLNKKSLQFQKSNQKREKKTQNQDLALKQNLL